MAVSKTMHGARGILSIDGTAIGIINSCSWGVNYDVSPTFIIGRFSPNELVLTGQDVINITCQGFRVVDEGPYASMSVAKLQDLLAVSDVTISLADRQTGKQIMTVTGCVSTGFNTGTQARSLSELTVNFQGLVLSDESGTQSEGPGASSF